MAGASTGGRKITWTMGIEYGSVGTKLPLFRPFPGSRTVACNKKKYLRLTLKFLRGPNADASLTGMGRILQVKSIDLGFRPWNRDTRRPVNPVYHDPHDLW